jgi:hypothetical protein
MRVGMSGGKLGYTVRLNPLHDGSGLASSSGLFTNYEWRGKLRKDTKAPGTQ